MINSIKINLYKVIVNDSSSVSIGDAIENINQRPQEDRMAVIKGYPMKMEKLDKLDNGVWIADFSKHKDIGPGLSSKEKETIDFNISEDENFGEMTAILLSPNRDFILVEYNHYGARASSIAEYLNNDTHPFYFEPYLKGDMINKLTKNKNSYIDWIETKFDFSGWDAIPAEFRNQINISNLRKAMQGFDDEAMRIQVRVSKQRGRYKKGMNVIKNKDFLTKTIEGSEQGFVSSSKVRIINSEEDGGEILDLINAKEDIINNIEWEPSEGERMIPFRVKQKALVQSYIHWRNKGIITGSPK